MKGFVSSVVVAVSMVSLFVGPSGVQAAPPKTFGAGDFEVKQLPNGGVSDVLKKNTSELELKEPRYDVLGLVSIESFGPSRRPRSSLKGVIVSKLFKPLDATYTISRWDGNAWTSYKSGNITIPANGTTSVTAQVRFTSEAMFYKLEVSAPSSKIHLSKQYRKKATPKPTFVVRYGTSGNRTEGHWVMAGVWSTANTQIDKVRSNASRLTKQMQDFGFEVRNETKHDLHWLDGQTYRIAVHIRTSEMLEREFATKEEAKAFHDSMRAAVPDSNLTIEDIRTKQP